MPQITEEINEDCDRKKDRYAHQDSNRDPSEETRSSRNQVTFLDNVGIAVPDKKSRKSYMTALQGVIPIKRITVVPLHTTKQTLGAEVQLHSFLTTTLDGGECQQHAPGN